MLRDVDCRAAVLAAEGEALREPQDHEDDSCGDADLRVCWQHSDQHRRKSHHRDRHEEGVFAADDVPESSEEHSAKGANEEAGGVGGERRERGGRRVIAWKEDRREERRECRVEIEVVPLDDGPGRSGRDHER